MIENSHYIIGQQIRVRSKVIDPQIMQGLIVVVFASIFTLAALLIAIFTCFTAKAAGRSAKAASQSVDAIRRAQEQRETGLQSSETGK